MIECKGINSIKAIKHSDYLEVDLEDPDVDNLFDLLSKGETTDDTLSRYDDEVLIEYLKDKGAIK